MQEKNNQSDTTRSILITAPAPPEIKLPMSEPLRWPHFESGIDAKGVINKLATFSPNVNFGMDLVYTNESGPNKLWLCQHSLVNHLAMIDVLSTSAFLNDWNLRTGFVEFSNPAAALSDLIFQMKQLAALAIRVSECLYVEVFQQP